jgi:hypothetical protein
VGACSFPSPPDAEWPEVEIVLVKPMQIRVTVRGVTRLYNHAEAGLASQRHPNRAKVEWRKLQIYAWHAGDKGAYYKLPKYAALRHDIAKFRKWLKSFFGIAGDPLQPFSSLWLPKFKIRAECEPD